MRSILGECSGNVRSTPTPKDCLRTVKVSRAPWPWRLIATPSKTWVRRRLPSITTKWTRRRSPARKSGTRRSWARSMLSMTRLMAKRRRAHLAPARCAIVARRRARRAQRPPRRGSAAALARPLEPPAADLLVVTREQDLGDAPAAEVRGTRVLRVFRQPLERLAVGLLEHRAGMTERAR